MDDINVIKVDVKYSYSGSSVVVNPVKSVGMTAISALPGPKGDTGDPATNLVQSVNGKQGVVVLSASDVQADPQGSASQALADANEYTDSGLNLKVDKVTGKGLSTNDYTTADASKLAGIATGAQVNTVTSVNTRTGAVVLDADDISDTATTNKFVTAAEKTKLSNLSGTNTGDNLIIGTTTPTPNIGAQVLWLDTTGGNITLNLVTGE